MGLHAGKGEIFFLCSWDVQNLRFVVSLIRSRSSSEPIWRCPCEGRADGGRGGFWLCCPCGLRGDVEALLALIGIWYNTKPPGLKAPQKGRMLGDLWLNRVATRFKSLSSSSPLNSLISMHYMVIYRQYYQIITFLGNYLIYNVYICIAIMLKVSSKTSALFPWLFFL